ncbi:hypothetical protein BDV06DRAFT_216939 [Aspergillus oleicola]
MTPTIDPASSRLFEPLQVSKMKLSHRIVFPPLTRNRNDDDHFPLPFMAKYYADRASTLGTLVISEESAVSHLEEGQDNTPGFVSERQKGSYYFHQIWRMGRASYPGFMARKGLKYRSSSAEEILKIMQSFVDTAKRIHCAHGYLLDQLLSDAVNKRTDKWGGSTENRARLVLGVVKGVVDAVSADRVALRLSPHAAFQQAEKGDIHGQYLYIIAQLKTTVPPLAYLSLVEATRNPRALIFRGGYHCETVAWALEERYKKWNTLIAFGRHFLTNPDLVFRIQYGVELNKYKRPTFYLTKNEVSYNDYPFSKEYLAARQAELP